MPGSESFGFFFLNTLVTGAILVRISIHNLHNKLCVFYVKISYSKYSDYERDELYEDEDESEQDYDPGSWKE